MQRQQTTQRRRGGGEISSPLAPRTLELGGPNQGRLLIRLQTGDASPRECLLTDAMFELLLVLVRSFLRDEYVAVNLLPAAGGGRGALFKLIERLRDAVGDDDHSLIVWDKATFYHIAIATAKYTKSFIACKQCCDPAAIDEIVRGVDERSRTSAASTPDQILPSDPHHADA